MGRLALVRGVVADCLVCFLPMPPQTGRGRPRKYHLGACTDRGQLIHALFCRRSPRQRVRRVPWVRVDRLREKRTGEFWEKVDKSGECWLWTGHIDGHGYGRLRGLAAYRLSYELTVGPIPDGLSIDHLCMVKTCVRPDHLEAVTNEENIRRYRDHIRSLIEANPVQVTAKAS